MILQVSARQYEAWGMIELSARESWVPYIWLIGSYARLPNGEWKSWESVLWIEKERVKIKANRA